ncbi:unnamed protein product, partial [Rhizoctonia solani]
ILKTDSSQHSKHSKRAQATGAPALPHQCYERGPDMPDRKKSKLGRHIDSRVYRTTYCRQQIRGSATLVQEWPTRCELPASATQPRCGRHITRVRSRARRLLLTTCPLDHVVPLRTNLISPECGLGSTIEPIPNKPRMSKWDPGTEHTVRGLTDLATILQDRPLAPCLESPSSAYYMDLIELPMPFQSHTKLLGRDCGSDLRIEGIPTVGAR